MIKVFSIVILQLALTTVVAGTIMHVKAIRDFVLATEPNESCGELCKQTHGILPTFVWEATCKDTCKLTYGPLQSTLFGGACVGGFILLLLLQAAKHQHPTNLVLLFLFTLNESYIVGVACASVQEAGLGHAVHNAAFATSGLLIFLVGTAFVTRKSFIAKKGARFGSLLSYLLMSTLLFLVMYSVVNLIRGNHVISLPMTLLGIFCFSCFIIFDTWRLMNELGPDDYIEAAISLYLDVLNLFLELLKLFLKAAAEAQKKEK